VPAPILIDLVATPPPGPDLANVLVATCSSVATGGGCAFSGEGPAQPARARVVVTFDAAYERVRVELAEGPHAGLWREATFREGDPAVERFRSAGLVVAGLVEQLERDESPPAPPAPSPEAAPARAAPAAPSRGTVDLSAHARIGWTNVRPWAGVAIDAAVPLGRSAFYLAAKAAYDHTWEASAHGISERRMAFGMGAGVSFPIIDGHLEVRPRLTLELQDVGAEVTDPATGRSDSGGRFLVGLTGELDLLVPLGPLLTLVGGADLALLGDSTPVLVHSQLATTIPLWMVHLSLGVGFRIP
jgi:hypothetical protein